MTGTRLLELEKRLSRAHAMVSRLCKGEAKWTMSVPARPDEDPDLVIDQGLRAGDELLAEMKRLKLEMAE